MKFPLTIFTKKIKSKAKKNRYKTSFQSINTAIMRLKTSSLIISILFIAISLPAKAEEQNSKKYESKLITNTKDRFTVTETKTTPMDRDVYDLSFVAYDKEFAKEFGFKDDYIEELDKGLRFIEVKMITEGKATNCYYNLVLDKSVEVDFPEENFVHQGSWKINYQLITPPETETYKKFSKLRAGKDLMNDTRFSNRLYIATKDYQSGKPGSAKNSSTLMYYIQDRLNYKIASIKGYCYFDAFAFVYGKPSIWIAKDRGISYNTMPSVATKHFNRFLIPESIAKEFTPIISNYQNRDREILAKEREEREKNRKKNKK